MAIARTWLRTLARGCVVAGQVFVVVGIGLASYTAVFLSHASRTTGAVIGVTAYTDGDGDVTYRPSFKFTTPSGMTITKDSDTGSNPARFHVGDHVPVLFSASNPSKAEIDDFVQLWLAPLVSGFIGIVFTVLGFCFCAPNRSQPQLVLSGSKQKA